jgi:hypothetical protein
VDIELSGVEGRQQRIVGALARLHEGCGGGSSVAPMRMRSGPDVLHIRLRPLAGAVVEANAVYRCLRDALVRDFTAASSANG